MNCNTFTGTANSLDIAMLGSNSSTSLKASVAKDQGVLTNQNIYASSDPKKLVRNQYGATCMTNLQRRWYVDNSGTNSIEHAGNSDVVTRPLTKNCSSTLLNIPNSTISFDFNTHCALNGNRPNATVDCPCRNCCLYDDISLGLSQQLVNVANLSTSVTAKIDGNRTLNLLAIIDAGLTNTALRDTLLAYGPYLSDTVMKKYFNKSSVTVSFAASVHNLNKPVKSGVWTTITSRGFTGASKDSMEARQGRGGANSRLQLEGHLNLVKADLENIYSEKLNYFLMDSLAGSRDTVIKLLAQNLGRLPNAVPLLVNAYANGHYYTRAFAYADSLAGDAKYTELMTLQKAILKLDTARSGIYKLLRDEDMMDLFVSYANDSTKAGSNEARAILNQVSNKPINLNYLLPEDVSTVRVANFSDYVEVPTETETDLKEATTLLVYPNPANTEFTMLYKARLDKEIKFSLVDVLGYEILTGNIRANEVKTFKIEMFNNGIYFIALKDEGKLLKQKKIIIMK